MISERQIEQIIRESVYHSLRDGGYLPTLEEVYRNTTTKLVHGLGAPTVSPVPFGEDDEIPVETLRKEYQNMLWDTSILTAEVLAQQQMVQHEYSRLAYRVRNVVRKADVLKRKLSSLRPRLTEATWVFYDSLEDYRTADIKGTSCYLDYVNGEALLPPAVHTVHPLNILSGTTTGTGRIWSLDDPVRANGVVVECLVPCRVKIKAGSAGVSPLQTVAESVVGRYRLIQFPPMDVDMLEVEVSQARSPASVLLGVSLVQVEFQPSAVYRSIPFRVEPNQIRQAGSIRATGYSVLEASTSVKYRLRVWYTDKAEGEPDRVVDDALYLPAQVSTVISPSEMQLSEEDGLLWVPLRYQDESGQVVHMSLSDAMGTTVEAGQNQYWHRTLPSQVVSQTRIAPGIAAAVEEPSRLVEPQSLGLVSSRWGTVIENRSQIDETRVLIDASFGSDDLRYHGAITGTSSLFLSETTQRAPVLKAGQEYGFRTWMISESVPLSLDLVFRTWPQLNPFVVSVFVNRQPVWSHNGTRAGVWTHRLSHIAEAGKWVEVAFTLSVVKPAVQLTGVSFFGWTIPQGVRAVPGTLQRVPFVALYAGASGEPLRKYSVVQGSDGGTYLVISGISQQMLDGGSVPPLVVRSPALSAVPHWVQAEAELLTMDPGRSPRLQWVAVEVVR